MITLISNVLYFLKTRPNFDVRYQIKPNHWNIFVAIFKDLWPCLFTTKLSYAQLLKWGFLPWLRTFGRFYLWSILVLIYMYLILIFGWNVLIWSYFKNIWIISSQKWECTQLHKSKLRWLMIKWILKWKRIRYIFFNFYPWTPQAISMATNLFIHSNLENVVKTLGGSLISEQLS